MHPRDFIMPGTKPQAKQREPPTKTYGPSPITRRQRRSKAEIGSIRDAIYTVVEAMKPMTVRQVFYQLVTRGVVEKREGEYKQTVGRLLLDMRVKGVIPFDWISDNTRGQRKPRSWGSMEDALVSTARTYRRALWNDQDVYVEIWTEKDAIAGVLMEETAPWDVPLMVSRGFSSVSYLYECAESITAIEKPAYIYYFGDHDPSGVAIDKAIEKRLRQFAPDAEINFERVAVLPWHIKKWGLPTRPTKTTDSRSKTFDGESVEVDASPPDMMRWLVRQSIGRHVDHDVLERTKLIEQSERQTLLSVAKQFQDGDAA